MHNLKNLLSYKNNSYQQMKIPKNVSCKFCLSSSNRPDLISPCGCKGTIKYVHRECLRAWRYASKNTSIKNCEQCLVPYNVAEEYIPKRVVVHLLSIICLLLIACLSSILIGAVVDTYFMTNNYERVDFNLITGFFFSACVYVFFNYDSKVEILNFYFTVIRLWLFNLTIDYCILSIISAYVILKLYRNLYHVNEHVFILFLNYYS